MSHHHYPSSADQQGILESLKLPSLPIQHHFRVQINPKSCDMLSLRLKNSNSSELSKWSSENRDSCLVSHWRTDPAGVWCFFSTGTDTIHSCQDSVDVAGISWRWEAALPASLIVQEAEFRECSEGKLETKARHTVYTKTGKRGRRLEGLLFASCKFIPIMCLQLRPVCTVCLQSGAINVIVRGCSWRRRLSYFSLPGSKWPLTALLLHCFSFPNVNASLDLYRPLYTLLFFYLSPFSWMEYKHEGAQFHNETSAQMCVSDGHREEGGLGGFTVGCMESLNTQA